MIIEDTDNPQDFANAKTIELTNLLDSTCQKYINNLITNLENPTSGKIKEIYQVMLHASVNFSAHTVLAIRDKLEDESQEFFVTECQNYFRQAIHEISEHKRKKDESAKNRT